VEKLDLEAIYEHGTLKLPRELPLREGQTVRVTIHASGGAVRRLAGLIPWRRDPEELERFLNDPDEGALGNRDL
jgi:predicted DNA-binding antitoxin AbrB/MazE fold protein